MKKIYAIVLVGILAISSATAQVEFAWSAGTEVVSSYLWRGQYNGGLSLQPEVSLGFESDHISLSVGAWGNIGASDWKFAKDQTPESLDTYFNPELDLFVDLGLYGLHLGATHYYYFDGSKYLVGMGDPGESSTQTEVSIGYDFADEFDFGLYFNVNTMIAGADGYYETDALGMPTGEYKRAFSTYIEVGYAINLPFEIALTPSIGLTPNKLSMYTDYEETWDSGKTIGLTNVSLRLEKFWEVGDHCSIGVFAQGMLNCYDLNKDNLWLNTSGEEKVGAMQKLNGCIGGSIWFE